MKDAMMVLEPDSERLSPALLLDARLPAEVTDSPAFREGCALGYCEVKDADWWDWERFMGQKERLLARVSESSSLVLLADEAGYVLGWLSVMVRKGVVSDVSARDVLYRLWVLVAERLAALAGTGAG